MCQEKQPLTEWFVLISFYTTSCYVQPDMKTTKQAQHPMLKKIRACPPAFPLVDRWSTRTWIDRVSSSSAKAGSPERRSRTRPDGGNMSEMVHWEVWRDECWYKAIMTNKMPIVIMNNHTSLIADSWRCLYDSEWNATQLLWCKPKTWQLQRGK